MDKIILLVCKPFVKYFNIILDPDKVYANKLNIRSLVCLFLSLLGNGKIGARHFYEYTTLMYVEAGSELNVDINIEPIVIIIVAFTAIIPSTFTKYNFRISLFFHLFACKGGHKIIELIVCSKF